MPTSRAGLLYHLEAKISSQACIREQDICSSTNFGALMLPDIPHVGGTIAAIP